MTKGAVDNRPAARKTSPTATRAKSPRGRSARPEPPLLLGAADERPFAPEVLFEALLGALPEPRAECLRGDLFVAMRASLAQGEGRGRGARYVVPPSLLHLYD